MSSLRLAFMGTPTFAVASLRALCDAGHQVVCVYTQPPRPAGRGRHEQRSAVHTFAEATGIPVRTPVSLRSEREHVAFTGLDLDAAIVVAYGLILPAEMLCAPRLGCLNVHASLLPRWRGAAPIQHALLAGDDESGVTIMQMEEGLDTGPILLQRSIPITPTMTAAELHDRLAELGARLLIDALSGLAAKRLVARPQPDRGATYAPKLTREEGRLDWRRPAVELERQVRALSPWPGAFAEVPHARGRERLKVLTAQAGIGNGRCVPGTLIDDFLRVCCGEGSLRLLRVQRPGRGVMEAEAFLRGFPLPRGARLPSPEGDR